ncbi:MAG: ATP-binding protein [Lachnospiraceae bacterium]
MMDQDGRGTTLPLKLPVGIENFEEIRTKGFYYVDKTYLIKEMLENWGKVNLFTRPRRFGKSLNMNMLKTFFEYGCDSTLFNGLKISAEKELCKEYMGRFPVISITLKDIDFRNFEGARAALCSVIGNEALRFRFLLESSRLNEGEKEQYSQLIEVDKKNRQGFVMEEEVLRGSLLVLSKILSRHYNQKVILLIDEYDVPLDKAYWADYYDEMVNLIRNLFSRVLKGNDSLEFAVVTGCLRIAKESIFTGLNNFKVYAVPDVRFQEYFGFSDEEVIAMLEYYGLTNAHFAIKEWYDGYQIGNADIYCPWDVINYVDLLRAEPDARPRAFWINTSGNDIIRKFLKMAKQSTRGEIERLVAGECIAKKVKEELTYRDLYRSIENVWSVLFTTGYLTKRGKAEGNIYQLAIPNREIREIFAEQILEWFQDEMRKDKTRLDAFCDAFVSADAEAIETQFTAYLKKTISIRDTAVRSARKENFYHGILLGLLSYREDWDVSSNAESGEGYSDILVETEDETGIVIEVKYAEDGDLEEGCKEALKQIRIKEYASRLIEDGVKNIRKYGIACWKKKCKVKMQI